ncbi:MAG: cadherin-like beta sandwich domain-containing protein [Bacilli bacterium]|nr:cadherin-like beta sandwich domain-containing protein [Bacilli bacterium]
MKNIKKILFFFIFAVNIFNFLPISVDAATGTVTMTANKSQVVVGNTVTYTVTVKAPSNKKLGVFQYYISYDSSMLSLTSGESSGAPVFTGSERSKTYTFKFKAKKSGTATVKFNVSGGYTFDQEKLTLSSPSKSVKIITQAQLEASYSKNNYLSSLGVTGKKISPSFNKNTLDYSLEVDNDVTSVNITGKVEDSKSSVTGLGNHQLAEGINKIQIKVTAQNGSTRTYILNITRKELSPIIVDIEGKKYNVVRKSELITSPNSNYEDTIIKINEEEVPAFINEVTKTTLVGLKDSEGNIDLYKYENDNYLPYKEFSFSNIIVTESSFIDIPKDYVKTTISVDEKEITAYKKESSPGFYLIYATNISNGISSLYQYDSHEKTIQLFNSNDHDENQELKEKNKNYEYIIIGLGSLLVVTYIVVLISMIKRSSNSKKKKKKINDNLEQLEINKDEKINNNEEIEQNIEKSDKIEENISRKHDGKKKKRKKK